MQLYWSYSPTRDLTVVWNGDKIVSVQFGRVEYSKLEALYPCDLLIQIIDYDRSVHWYNFDYATIDNCILAGTDFQLKVWSAISKILPGTTKTYSEIAQEIGHPKAVRAIGTACGKNPVPVVVPCHRVVGKSNPLAFGGGPERKRALLSREGINI